MTFTLNFLVLAAQLYPSTAPTQLRLRLNAILGPKLAPAVAVIICMAYKRHNKASHLYLAYTIVMYHCYVHAFDQHS